MKTKLWIEALAQRGDQASTEIAAANEQLLQLADNLSALIRQFKIDWTCLRTIAATSRVPKERCRVIPGIALRAQKSCLSPSAPSIPVL